MKKIVHIAGMDMYASHEPGNYIVFSAMRDLPYDSHHLLGLVKGRADNDTSYHPISQFGNQIGVENSFESADVVILYDSLLQPETVKAIYDKHKCPIVFVAMVNDHFTGGCCYVFDCENFQSSCGSCPQLHSNGELTSMMMNKNMDAKFIPSTDGEDKTFQLMQRKIKSWEDIPITGVAVSNYSLSLFKKSSLFKDKRCELIPIPFDIPVFKGSRNEAQNTLGYPEGIENKFLILWGTTNPDGLRKGRKYADAALNHLYNRMKEKGHDVNDVVLVTVGPNPTIPFNQSQPFRWAPIGYIPTREKLSCVFRSVNVGLQTTFEDAGPMMSVECLSNQTPLVSFDRCVSADVINHGKSGYIVDTYDSIGLGESLLKVYESKVDMGIEADVYVKEFNNKEKVLHKWQELIEDITQ